MEVLRSRKPLFMDKPIAATFPQVLALYTVADALQVPVFSSSSLRWLAGCQAAQNGEGQLMALHDVVALVRTLLGLSAASYVRELVLPAIADERF